MSTVTLTLHLPARTPLHTLRDWADAIGCELRLQADGSYIARPRGAVQTNEHIVKIPRHKGQYMHHDPRREPETA